MSKSPKDNEEKMQKVLTAWKTLAISKSFGGMTFSEFAAMVDTCITPRTRLAELEDEKMQQQANRDAADELTMAQILLVVAGVVADPTEGANGALYEAMGYVRKSERRSGLTRKKITPEPTPQTV